MWSINERLGGNPGINVEELDGTWKLDIIDLQIQESEELENNKTSFDTEGFRRNTEGLRSNEPN